MTSIRRMIGRLFGRRGPAVAGPTRIYVRRIPAGAVLDVEHYLTSVITTLVDDHLDDLLALADDRAAAREYDGHEPEQLLVETLRKAIGYELPLYGADVEGLAARLLAVAPAVRIPRQRAEGGLA